MDKPDESPNLTDAERRELLRIARASIGATLGLNPEPSLELSTPTLLAVGGAFVTLELRGALRGCVGTANPRDPLHLTVWAMAKAAAFEDPRFPNLGRDEFEAITIEISCLTPIRSVRADEVIPGRHGVLIARGAARGLLLPQVARRYGWDRERFLRETCRKAGLPADTWMDPGTEVLVFEAEVFGEEDLSRHGEPGNGKLPG
jgi:AmmeMemoRadiSam system protein A